MTDPSSESAPFGRFFLPGPTEVRPEILRAQARPMIGHRGRDVRQLMEALQTGLMEVFQTERPVFVSTSSATGLMEAAVRNGVAGRMLALVNGAFSERFARIAGACGVEMDVIEVEWGGVHDPDEVRARLSTDLYDAVTVVHSETSTGALQDLVALAEVVDDFPDTLLLVDSVTGVGGAEVRTDAWGLDFVLTGSQKALALPPGLAFGVASDAMMTRSEAMTGKGVYFDMLAFRSNLEKLQTPNTPALSLMYALAAQLRHIREETMEGRWRRHLEMASRVWAWVDHMRDARDVELAVLAPLGYRSPTVTCIRLPERTDGRLVVERVRERGWVIGAGYGRLADSTIRIGHMGDHTVDGLQAVLAQLEDVLTS